MAGSMIAQRMHGIADAMVESQLGHGKSGQLGSACDRADCMKQRRGIMPRWAEFLDKLHRGTNAVR